MSKAAIYCRLSEEDRNKKMKRMTAAVFKIKRPCCWNTQPSTAGKYMTFTAMTITRVLTETVRRLPAYWRSRSPSL